ncbi:MAG: hypothetical protein F6K23_15720 [Okeania sp. SIO2C9]|nr:hypothetical protein [Okeania sp. SIO2C9]NEQ74349.1 hypothetical protein [Okeania sp. SIO2C9]
MAETPNSPTFLQIEAIKIGAIQAKKSFLLAAESGVIPFLKNFSTFY